MEPAHFFLISRFASCWPSGSPADFFPRCWFWAWAEWLSIRSVGFVRAGSFFRLAGTNLQLLSAGEAFQLYLYSTCSWPQRQRHLGLAFMFGCFNMKPAAATSSRPLLSFPQHGHGSTSPFFEPYQDGFSSIIPRLVLADAHPVPGHALPVPSSFCSPST